MRQLLGRPGEVWGAESAADQLVVARYQAAGGLPSTQRPEGVWHDGAAEGDRDVGRLLLTRAVVEASTGDFAAIADRTGIPIEPVMFPEVDAADLTADEQSAIEGAYLSRDLFIGAMRARGFFEAVEQAPNLRWLHLGGAGIDAPRFGTLLDRGVQLSNSPGAAAEPIAHSAMAGMLSLARRLPYFGAQQRERVYERLPPELIPDDLSAQTLVVFGLGTIGGELARLARAFGLYVIGVRRRPRTAEDEVDELVQPDRLDEVLRRADWLAVTANLTPETRGAISAERLALLPRGAQVINVARGAIVDEPALTAALQSGALGGAYLDVFAVEPLPPESPLWTLPNVIVSPHNSWAARGNVERARLIFLANLEAWLRGDPLPQEVHER